MPAAVPKESLKEFARRLYKFMTEKGMSQSDLARAVWGETEDPRGFMVAKNRDRVSQYLNARSLPDPENTLKLANALGVTPEDLIPARPGYLEQEEPEISVVALAGKSDEVRLIINKVVPFQLAAEILQKLSAVV